MCAHQRQHLRELGSATDQLSRLHRQVRLVQALQRRKVAVAELVEPLRLDKVLEPMVPEVTQDDAVG